MICLFRNKTQRDDVLKFNGDYILDDIVTKCTIKESLNGIFECELIVILDKDKPIELYDMISEDSILKIPDEYNDEVFRISSVRKSDRYITVLARQITIADTLNLWLEDVRPVEQNGTSTLNYILNNSNGNKEIFVNSNISKVNTAYYENLSMYQAISDSENSFLERWGGEIKRERYNLTINNKRGSNNGVQIRSRKNLIGFEARTNIDSLCTVIYPKGFDKLKGKAVISPLVNKYSNPIPREIKYQDIKFKNENNPDEGFETEAEALKELQRVAELEFSQKGIDKLKASYTINFIELSKTDEYKEYQMIEKVDIGDVVKVIEDNYKIDIDVKVLEREYDVISKRRLSTTLSNEEVNNRTISIGDVLAEIQNQSQGDKDLSSYITGLINEGLKDSYVTLKPNELLIMDSKDINAAKNVTRYNKNGLAFSQNGYYGEYTYGFTIDGKINASLIATGVLSTVLIQNIDGSLQIDLSSGKGISFNSNGHKAINISHNSIFLYDWQGTERNEPIGRISSVRRGDASDKPGLMIANEKKSYMSMSYKSDYEDTYYPYIEFDSDKILNPLSREQKEEQNKEVKSFSYNPIRFREGTDFLSSTSIKHLLNFGKNDETTLYNSNDNNFVTSIQGDKKFLITRQEDSKVIFNVGDNSFYLRGNDRAYLFKNNDSNRVVVAGDLEVQGDIYTTGTVRGVIKNMNGEVIYPPQEGGGGSGVTNGIPSAKLYRFVKGYEGFGAYPYKVSGESFYTAGYGVTERYKPEFYNQLKPFPTTERKASEIYGNMLISDFATPLKNRMISDGVDINKVAQNHFDAFCSLAMNGGLGAVWNSPMYATWKTNPYDPSIPQRWLTWYINSGTPSESGLRARRRAEVNIWNNSIYEFRSIVTITSTGGYGPPVSDNNGNGYIPPVFGDLYGTNDIRNSIVNSARKIIGLPYVWGGNYKPLGSSSGTDCSGLCQWAFNDNGIKITRTTYTQINEGKEVYVNDLQPGDLVFSNFQNGQPEHVFIFSKKVDGVLYCIEAPRTGLNIRERSFTFDSGMRARRLL